MNLNENFLPKKKRIFVFSLQKKAFTYIINMCLKIKQKFGMEVHYIVENNKAKMNEKEEIIFNSIRKILTFLNKNLLTYLIYQDRQSQTLFPALLRKVAF